MALRLGRKNLRKCGKHPRGRLVQEDPRRARIDMAKIVRQSHARHLRQSACHFHAHRSCADQDKREQLAYFLRVRVVERCNLLGALEGQQDLAANQVSNT